MKQQFRIPVEQPSAKSRADRFNDLNKKITAAGGWLISLPSADKALVECLPGSPLPDILRRMGNDVIHVGEAERILPAAVEQRFTTGPDGELEAITCGSTRAVTLTMKHAGIITVERWAFSLP